jgi:hypothetical protein
MTASSTSSSNPAPLLDLHRLLAGIRWRRRFWATCAAAGLIAGIALTIVAPAGSTAVASILVVHAEEGQPEAMETDVALFETSQVAGAALQILGSDAPPQALLGSYYGEPLAPNVLQLTVTAGIDQDALARAQALAEAYIAFNVERAAKVAEAESAALRDRRARVETELADVANAIADASPQNLNRLEILQGRRASLSAQVDELERLAEEAAIGAPRVGATQIVDSPRLIGRPFAIEVMINGLAGLVLGLGVGLALATIATVVKDRPVLRRDIAANLGASVIAQLPAPHWGPTRFWRSPKEEHKRVTAAMVRLVRGSHMPLSLLELGCPRAAAALAVGMAQELALDGAVQLVDGLPGSALRQFASAAQSELTVVDIEDAGAPGPMSSGHGERRIGVGSVGPGTAWTDLRHLGTESLLVVCAGYAEVTWLHTVARQLADADIFVLGVVLVHPDPRDRSDGTLWDALHTALRGRATAYAAQSGNGHVNGHGANGAAAAASAATAVVTGDEQQAEREPAVAVAATEATRRPAEKLPPVAATPPDHSMEAP